MSRGFKGMPGGNLQALMQQAQKMKANLEKSQQAVEAYEAEVSTGGGMVSLKMNGKYQITHFKIDPQVVDRNDVEMLQDLIKAAVNQASEQIKQHSDQVMSEATGGMAIPGLF